MTNKIFREKKHRLDAEFYSGEKIVSFSICIKEGKRIFINDSIFNIFGKILIPSLEKYNSAAVVYLFMPDHVHMILAGRKTPSNVLNSMKIFKQKTGFWFSQNVPDIKWQKDFYDHILRNNKDMKNQIRYILNNPVRKGLVSNWKDYPYKGSTLYDLNELM
jgi:putative transposase